MSNDIPFSNLDPDMAIKAPRSPFMEFHISIPGMEIFCRRTKTQVFRWEIWNKYMYRPDQIELLQRNEHSQYVLIPKETFDDKK